jgi:putative ABC transport system permease protein
MNGLDRKLWRDLVHLRGQVIAIMVMVACGAMSFVAMRTTWLALLESQQEYYQRFRFGDVFTELKRAPDSLRSRLAEIPGVAQIQTRIVAEVTIDVPGLDEPATGRLISLTAQAPESKGDLNDIHLVAGERPGRDHPDEVVISEAFANANQLQTGDRISAVINGNWRNLLITGIALSPEYIYEIRPGDIFPDPRRFGVLWMHHESLAPVFDMSGAFNDISLALAPGADRIAVVERIDRLVEPYGGLGAYDRREQSSHRFISNELDELRVFCTWIPGIFLGVTAFLLHIVLSRLVFTQRDQIGVLKAFGYGNRMIGTHYLKLALIAVMGGILPGLGLGYLWGRSLAGLYAEFFRFPVLYYRIDPGVIGWAVTISSLAAVLGALGAVRRAIAIPPAEAMRPEPPARFRSGFLERLGLQTLLNLPVRIILRNLERTPIKSALTLFGISLSVAILFIGFYFYDAIDHLVEIEFRQILREDATLFFRNPLPPGVQDELRRRPGVLEIESFRALPARLSSGQRSKRLAILGMESDGELRRVIDVEERVHSLPTAGVILTTKLAELLAVGRGDTVTVEPLEGNRLPRQVLVAGVVDDMMGLNAYMTIEALARLMADGGAISGVHLRIDQLEQPRLYRQFKETPAIKGILIPEAMLDNFNRTMARTIGSSTTITILLACILAFGLVYNAARIALSERGRELASLRVLGFTQGEITVMLLGEQAILTAGAIPLGYLIGYGLCGLITRAIDTELIRLPLVLTPRTFLYAGGIVVIAALFSALLIRHRLQRLNLIEVLKTRE